MATETLRRKRRQQHEQWDQPWDQLQHEQQVKQQHAQHAHHTSMNAERALLYTCSSCLTPHWLAHFLESLLLLYFHLSFHVSFFSFHLLHCELYSELDNLIAMQNLCYSANKWSDDAYDVSTSLTKDGSRSAELQFLWMLVQLWRQKWWVCAGSRQFWIWFCTNVCVQNINRCIDTILKKQWCPWLLCARRRPILSRRWGRVQCSTWRAIDTWTTAFFGTTFFGLLPASADKFTLLLSDVRKHCALECANIVLWAFYRNLGASKGGLGVVPRRHRGLVGAQSNFFERFFQMLSWGSRKIVPMRREMWWRTKKVKMDVATRRT